MPYVRPMLSGKARHMLLVSQLENELPKLISEALSVSHPFPPSHVTIDGVFLDGYESSPSGVRPPQHAQVDVAILIFCNVYPERVAKADEIAQKILDGLLDLLSEELTVWVYLPMLGGYAQSQNVVD